MSIINNSNIWFRVCLLSGLIIGGLLILNGTWIHAKAWLAQILIQQAWAETLSGKQEVRPWPWADTWPVAKLGVEAANTEYYVLNGATGSALAFGPGHYQGTALPGTKGTTVIAGHRDTQFRFLERIAIGDELWIENIYGKAVKYVISNKSIFNSRKENLTIDNDSGQLILVTCYPFAAINPGGPLRMVVTAYATIEHANSEIL